jgi:sporulation protein YlmC with PRC-barrel domain
MEIQDAQNEKLGKVEELAVDVQSGRIVYVIVTSDGKTTAVPPRAFSVDAPAKALRLNATKEMLKAAPAFEAAHYGETNRVGDIYRHFGQQPYHREAQSRTTAGQGSPGFEKASKLIGMTVKNRQDEKLGTVDNMAVDLAAGRIVHVIISSGGFLGIRDALSAVPPAAFNYDQAQQVLLLDMTKEALSQAPHFKNNQWPDLGDPAYSAQVYRAHRQQPYFSQESRGTRDSDRAGVADKDADNTGRNVRDRDSDRLTPIQQGSSEPDVEMTRNIRKEILNQKGLSVNARNVKVITSNGRVTLRGPVNSEEEKRQISEIAERMAQRPNVDNQLEVTRQVRD